MDEIAPNAVLVSWLRDGLAHFPTLTIVSPFGRLIGQRPSISNVDSDRSSGNHALPCRGTLLLRGRLSNLISFVVPRVLMMLSDQGVYGISPKSSREENIKKSIALILTSPRIRRSHFGFEALEKSLRTKLGLTDLEIIKLARQVLIFWEERVEFNEISVTRSKYGNVATVKVCYTDPEEQSMHETIVVVPKPRHVSGRVRVGCSASTKRSPR